MHSYGHYTRKCRTLWGRAWASSYYAYVRAHEQTKLHTEVMSWIASVYECRLCTTLTWSNLNPTVYNLYGSLPLIVSPYLLWQTRSKVPCVLKFEPSPLRLPMPHSGSSPPLPFPYMYLLIKCTRTFNFREIFKRAFKIYGTYMAASKQVRYKHTSAMQFH